MRRRSKQPLSLVSAVAVEVVTLLVIVACAQPTWTRQVVQQMIDPVAPAADSGGSVVSAELVPQSMRVWEGGNEAALKSVASHATDLSLPAWPERIARTRAAAEVSPILPPPNDGIHSVPRRY